MKKIYKFHKKLIVLKIYFLENMLIEFLVLDMIHFILFVRFYQHKTYINTDRKEE
ncbi:hypothetical protein [Thermosipho affectus]|uniref:hypothetical protein n=1 Tax=Thermosipho affectus TaxID=660294 RepID=UPI0013011DA0|nr:hypothetical protein [Thermosipho affectus]